MADRLRNDYNWEMRKILVDIAASEAYDSARRRQMIKIFLPLTLFVFVTACTPEDTYEARLAGGPVMTDTPSRYASALPVEDEMDSQFQSQNLGSLNLSSIPATESPLPLGSYVQSLATKLGFAKWKPPVSCDFAKRVFYTSDTVKSSDLSLTDAASYNRVFRVLGSLNSCQVERPSPSSFSFNLKPSHAAGVLLGSSSITIGEAAAYNQLDRLYCSLGGEARDRTSFTSPVPWTAGNLGTVTKFASCLCASLMSESPMLTTRLLTVDGRAGAPVQKDSEKARVAGTLVEEVMGLSSSRPNYEIEKNNILALFERILPTGAPVVSVNPNFSSDEEATLGWASACTYMMLHPDTMYY